MVSRPKAVGEVSSHISRLFPVPLLFISCALIACLPSAHGGEAEEQRSEGDTIAVLNSAIETWAMSIKFQATFKYHKRTVENMEIGLAGNLSSLSDGYDATGIIAKDLEAFRMRLDYGQPPVDASLTGSGDVVSNISFDEVISPDMILYYLPKFNAFGNSVAISAKQEKDRDSLKGGHSARVIWTPFHFGGGIDGGPIRSMQVLIKPTDTWEEEVIQDEGDRVTVKLLWISNDGQMRQERNVTFWTQPAIPVVEEVKDRFVDERRGLSSTTVVRADQFTECDGGMLARRVVSVGGPINASDGSTLFVAEEWVATEMKPRPAQDAFEITVPKGTSINGLISPPSTANGPVTLRLTDYKMDDLNLSPGPVGQTEVTKRFGTGRVIGIIVTIIVLIMLLLFVVRKRGLERA